MRRGRYCKALGFLDTDLADGQAAVDNSCWSLEEPFLGVDSLEFEQGKTEPGTAAIDTPKSATLNAF